MDMENRIREVLHVVKNLANVETQKSVVEVGTKRIMEIIAEEALKDGNSTKKT